MSSIGLAPTRAPLVPFGCRHAIISTVNIVPSDDIRQQFSSVFLNEQPIIKQTIHP
jgi:hypothetical protein